MNLPLCYDELANKILDKDGYSIAAMSVTGTNTYWERKNPDVNKWTVPESLIPYTPDQVKLHGHSIADAVNERPALLAVRDAAKKVAVEAKDATNPAHASAYWSVEVTIPDHLKEKVKGLITSSEG